jgi:CheY-like chemotaxis protein
MTRIEDNGAARMTEPMGDGANRVLIVDDDPGIHALLGFALRVLPVEVSFALDGKVAMSLVDAQRPDLIILDLQMPEMDGLEVLERLGANPETANVPVIVFSGFVECAYSRANGLMKWPAQVVEVLKKPVQLPVLRELIREHLCPDS